MKIVNAEIRAESGTGTRGKNSPKPGRLFIDRFEIKPDQAWCVIGSNRSGIRDFFDLVCGRADTVKADQLVLPAGLCRVCFKDQQQIYELELKNDDTDYMDRPDPGTLGRDFIDNIDAHRDLIDTFGMTACMDRGYRQMSTGQARKLMILSQMTKKPSTLAIQAPFEGLDARSRKDLSKALAYLHSQKIRLILFVYNIEDIPGWCTHLALIRQGRITIQGTRGRVMEQVLDQLKEETPDFHVSVQDIFAAAREKKQTENRPAVSEKRHPQKDDKDRPELVCLKNGSAGYGGEPVFKDISLRVFEKDHTLITGPNGCGKSTLLHVITGDHPACYTNDLKIFDIQRGTGESIWELKKRMGIVSPELHRNYHIPGSTIHCIISGLFDSIGLYRPFSPRQRIEAERWLDHLGMKDKANIPFRDLTFADQRLVLIARALIKQPDLLILDEPTQGLDAANRKALLDFLEEMTQFVPCTVLYVSHREDEYRAFFVNHIQMGGV